ncbi:hypothetical protein [Streptomyces sp. DT117]|uniref:hypothetical protein n=1 Tax=Streptomyces sp. DT117 TaxID=3393422 RepID=UPI003CE7D2BB
MLQEVLEHPELLQGVSDAAGDASEGRSTEAEGILDALHEDMCVHLEIDDLLARLRGPEGPRPY